MYKLYENMSVSEIRKTIRDTDRDMKYYAKSFACFFGVETVGIAAIYAHNIIENLPQFLPIVGGIAAIVQLRYLAIKALENYNDNKEAWYELGKQMKIEENSKKATLVTRDQQIMQEFTRGDKVVDISLYTNPSSETSGGRAEELGGRQRVMNLPS